ncbi:fasciclin domain-containing protein [Aspergillus fijiensis CBS 313.89]|uniref:FAS1 domain-containing protein n=1 Tax=Aspergillus fijiensis CBS 313.89 TaxID=1448319 RepID=A0A8G1RQ95_9EURO|nr:FAS1 domain-containing protein [Aspergillus fijiensis CBS 313.89]RAK76798.1 FAS1 domain-containing protein [Aspergillus fijiensis CBS 313.89]
MKHLQYWAVAALPLTSAFLIPPKQQQQAILHEPKPDLQEEHEAGDHQLFDILSLLESAVETYSPVQQITSWLDEVAEATNPSEEHLLSPPPPPFRRPSPPPYPHHPPSNKSLYDLISENPHTTILARIVHDDSQLVELLNRTAANLTFFAPTDEAFAKIPHHHHDRHRHHDDRDSHDGDDDDDDDDRHHHKPRPELIRAVLKYHLVSAVYTPAELFHAHTLPTLLTSRLLSPKPDAAPSIAHSDNDNDNNNNNLPQRLSISTTLHGPTLNHYSRILATDKRGANGLLYTIDAILLPPPSLLTLTTIVPTQFSTLTLALHRTGLAAQLNRSHHCPHHTKPSPGDPTPKPTTKPPSPNLLGKSPGRGGTYFLPTNRAFSALGYKLNAFLFSEHGTPYLRALLKYHLVPHRTLYSDVEYTSHGKIEAVHGLKHFDLETWLEGRTVSVEVANLGPWGGVTVSGERVGVRDLVVADGVGHVLTRSVLVPRCEGDSYGDTFGDTYGEMTVEELVGRLQGLVDLESEDGDGEEEAEEVVWGQLHDLLEL